MPIIYVCVCIYDLYVYCSIIYNKQDMDAT